MNAPPQPEIENATRRRVEITTADAGTIGLSVNELGEGPPVLLVHGFPQHAGAWHRLAPLLAGEMRLIAPDLRGFGASDAPAGGYDPATFASDFAALLDALEIDRAHVIGHDWGGAAAFELALSHRDRVDRMLVLNTVAPWIRPSLEAVGHFVRATYVPAMALAGPWIAQNHSGRLATSMRKDVLHRDMFTAQDARGYADALRPPERARAIALLYRTYLRLATTPPGRAAHAHDRLEVPTHFLFAIDDGYIHPALIRGIEDHCDDLTVEFTAGSGHFVAEELPHLVAARAREHLLQIPA